MRDYPANNVCTHTLLEKFQQFYIDYICKNNVLNNLVTKIYFYMEIGRSMIEIWEHTFRYTFFQTPKINTFGIHNIFKIIPLLSIYQRLGIHFFLFYF